MLENYLIEIIALMSIVAVIILTYLLKQNKKNNIESIQIRDNDNSLNVTKKNTTKKEPKEINLTSLNGKEEGSFGVNENLSEEYNSNNKQKITQKRMISKRNVPAHPKISKKNFKEFSGTKILVAEDNLINQKVISGLLADSGIEVTMADDGQDALDILKQNNDFNLILMDAHMPRINGFEATRLIRANPNYDHIVVIALSGDTASDDIKKMIDAGMEEQLEKPLRMDALYDVIYAYTGDTYQESNSDDFIEVVMTKELNGAKGLSVCGGDEIFYREILNEFQHTYFISSDKIYEYLDNNQMEEVDKLLLDVIGITANIGADSLKEVSINLKDALQDTKEKSYLTLAQQYEVHLHRLLKDIKDYL